MSKPDVRLAESSDIEAVSHLRLQGLRTDPTAFSRDYETDAALSDEDWNSWFAERHDGTTHAIFVAETDGQLVGMAGVARERGAKLRHNGFIWGVYVQPSERGIGIGGRLSKACLAWADDAGIEIVRLAVNSQNTAAIRLYSTCGFQVYGLSPRELRFDGVDHDELLMARIKAVR